MAITAYGIYLAPVTSFKYIGRVLLTADNDWPVVVHNLRRASNNWKRLTRVLIREGADAQTLGQIYLAVVQSVIIYGSETWVIKTRIERVLGGFHHRVTRRLMGRQPWRIWNIVWVYPPLEDAIAEAGFQEVDTYAYRSHKTAAQFIATRPIMDLCLVAERRPGSRVTKRQWEQDTLDHGLRYAIRHRSIMGLVAINCAAVFWLR